MRHEAAANFVKYALSTFIIERTWRRRRFWPSARPKIFIAQNERLIILGCFWSDQPLGCSVFLRHGATVTTVPLEGVAQGKHIDGGRCATAAAAFSHQIQLMEYPSISLPWRSPTKRPHIR